MSTSETAIPMDLVERFGDAITVAADGAWEIALPPGEAHEALEYLGLQREPAFDYLIDLFGVDYGDEFEVVYQVSRVGSAEIVRLRTRVPRRNAEVQSVTDIWAGAAWAEREMREMYGINVDRLPDQRNLLLPEGWKGYPLRKDYEYPKDHPWLSRDPMREDPGKFLKDHPADDQPTTDG